MIIEVFYGRLQSVVWNSGLKWCYIDTILGINILSENIKSEG
jgi:hypothetical protein